MSPDDSPMNTSTSSVSTASDLRGIPIFTKPVVACDCDEVLARFILTVLKFHNEKYGTDFRFEDFFSYNFKDVWGGTKEEAFAKLDQFFDSHHFDNIPPIEEAAAVLQRLTTKFDLVVVTARHNMIEDATRKWIDRHFKDIFKDVLFGNHWERENEVSISKAELCKSVNAIALIDDAIGYILDVAPVSNLSTEHSSLTRASTVVHKAILFNENDSYGWTRNLDQELPSNCVKCLTWEEVEKELMQLYEKVVPVEAKHLN